MNVHSIKNFDPADHELIGWYYLGSSEWMADAINVGLSDEVWSKLSDITGGFSSSVKCQHCGQPHLYGATFRYKPDGSLVFIGNVCAGKLCGLETKAQLIRQRLKRKAELAREKAEAERDARNFIEEQEPEFADALEVDHHIIRDIKSKLFKYGSLSDAQVDLVLKIAREQQEKAEELADAPAIEEGRREITGTIVSCKEKQTPWGDQLKMLVEDDDGNRYYGSAPKALQKHISTDPSDLKGKDVSFTGSVEPSNDDEHFGFFKRPTKAVLGA